MAIWVLEPLSSAALPDAAACPTRRIVVRALTEEAARLLAAADRVHAGSHQAGAADGALPRSPSLWLDATLSGCRRVDPQGAEEVLAREDR